MDTLLQDIRYAFRSLRKTLAFTSIAVITLAMGIGAVTTLFTVVNSVLWRPLPYQDPDRLMLLWASNPSQGQERYFTSPGNYVDWRDQTQTFEQMSAFWPTTVALTDPESDPARVRMVLVSHEFHSLLGVPAQIGRTFNPEDARTGAESVVIMSHSLWQGRFGGEDSIIGETITVDGAPRMVVGVMPPGFSFPEDTDLWTNINWDLSAGQSRYARWMSVIGRLAPGIEVETARADMQVVTQRLAEEYPGPNQGWTSTMASLHEEVVGDIGPALLVLLGATGLILLIACANVANLTLSRSESRHQEIAVRVAIGARRSRIVRQLITESLVLASTGALLGVGAAAASVQLLKVFGPSELPRIDQIALDARVAAFAVAGTLLTGLLFGLAPIVHLLRTNLQDSLKDGSKGSAGVVSLRLRNAFVVAQVALAVMLVIGSGLLIRSFSNLSNTDPGFEAAGVLTMELDLPSASYADDEAVAAFYAAFSQRLQALPGVSTASMTSSLPLGESLDYLSSFLIANREPPPPGEQNRTYYRQVGHDFFKTMGIPLVKGRHFTAADRADAPGAVIINEAMARQFFPDEDPIGEVLTQTQQRYGPLGAMLLNEVEVVGVVRDVRYVGLKEEPQPSLYFPHQQAPFRRMTVILRTATDPTSMIAAARYELAEIDPDMPISRIQSMEQVLADSIAQERFAMLLLGVFALTALTLAAVGIYGVLSYNVEQRTRELGIRIVLGADASDVREYVLRRSLWLVGGGILIGLVGAFSLSRILVSQLYGVASTDLITFISVPILLALVALVASYTPAQRATRVDPIVALRYQ